MNGVDVRLVSVLCLPLCLFVFSGCTDSLKVPLNEYSHLNMEATPFDQEFRISYHLYEATPRNQYSDVWESKLKFKLIGTVYDSQKDYSPAARRIEQHWNYVWDDGFQEWSTLKELLMEGTQNGEGPEARSQHKELEAHHERRTPRLPIAELSTFMFATQPKW